MNHHDHTASGGERKPDPPWLADVEALSMEISGELREIVEMLTIYPEAIANAARLLARAHISPPAGCPEPFELGVSWHGSSTSKQRSKTFSHPEGEKVTFALPWGADLQ